MGFPLSTTFLGWLPPYQRMRPRRHPARPSYLRKRGRAGRGNSRIMPFGEAHLALRFPIIGRRADVRGAVACALRRLAPAPPCEFGLANWPAGSAIANDRLGLRTAPGIHDGHAGPFGGKVPAAKDEQRNQNRTQATRWVGRYSFRGGSTL
jgi:hypothetical protein